MKIKFFCILVLALFLRLISINQSFWIDEATSARIASSNFAEILNFLKGDFHPPFYYLLLKLWVNIFSATEISVRMVSLISSLGICLLVFFITRLLTSNKTTPFVAFFLLAIAPLDIYYAQEARMYELASFLVTFSTYLYIKAIHSKRNIFWILLSIVLVLIFLTDYLAILILPVFILHQYIWGKPKYLVKLGLLILPLLLAFLLWSPYFLLQLNHGLAVESSNFNWWMKLGSFSIKNVVLVTVKFLLGRIYFESKYIYGLITSIMLLIAAKSLSKSIKFSPLISLWLTFPIIVGVLISFYIPVLSYFRFLFCLPALYILVAIGFEKKTKINNFLISIFILISFGCSLIYLFNNRFHRENWRGMVDMISENSKYNKNLVLFVANSQMEAFEYYTISKNLNKSYGDKFLPVYDKIYLMRYVWDIFDPKNQTKAKVESYGYELVQEHDFNGVVVWEYNK